MTWWVPGAPPGERLWVHFGWYEDGFRTHTADVDAGVIRELMTR